MSILEITKTDYPQLRRYVDEARFVGAETKVQVCRQLTAKQVEIKTISDELLKIEKHHFSASERKNPADLADLAEDLFYELYLNQHIKPLFSAEYKELWAFLKSCNALFCDKWIRLRAKERTKYLRALLSTETEKIREVLVEAFEIPEEKLEPYLDDIALDNRYIAKNSIDDNSARERNRAVANAKELFNANILSEESDEKFKAQLQKFQEQFEKLVAVEEQLLDKRAAYGLSHHRDKANKLLELAMVRKHELAIFEQKFLDYQEKVKTKQHKAFTEGRYIPDMQKNFNGLNTHLLNQLSIIQRHKNAYADLINNLREWKIREKALPQKFGKYIAFSHAVSEPLPNHSAELYVQINNFIGQDYTGAVSTMECSPLAVADSVGDNVRVHVVVTRNEPQNAVFLEHANSRFKFHNPPGNTEDLASYALIMAANMLARRPPNNRLTAPVVIASSNFGEVTAMQCAFRVLGMKKSAILINCPGYKKSGNKKELLQEMQEHPVLDKFKAFSDNQTITQDVAEQLTQSDDLPSIDLLPIPSVY